jgi:uncharacterized protein YlbG (UPF0298 family)
VVSHHRVDPSGRIAQDPISSGRSIRPPRTVYLHRPAWAGGNLSAWGTLYYQSIKSRVILHHGIDLFGRIAINPISAVRSTRPPRTVYLHHPSRAGGNLSAWGTLHYQSVKSRVVLHHGIDLFDRIAINPISSGWSTRPPQTTTPNRISTPLRPCRRQSHCLGDSLLSIG